MKKYILHILSYLTAMAAVCLGIVISTKYPTNIGIIVTLSVISLVPLAIIPYNIICSKKFVSRINNTKVADMTAFLVSHRDDAENTAKAKLKKLQRLRRLTALYTVFLAVTATAIAFLCSFLTTLFSTAVSLPLAFYSWLVYFAVYSRIHKNQLIELNENAVILPKDEYPLLHSLVRKAADKVGCKHNTVILLSWDCSASILNDRKTVYLQLGVILLHTLTEDELYTILLHEFAHVSDNNRSAFREKQYNEWLYTESRKNGIFGSLASNLYLMPDTVYSFEYSIYQYASSVTEELQADKAMATYGNAETAVSALLKTHYDAMYCWEGYPKDGNYYESEKPKADYLTRKIAAFKAAIEERHSFWDEMVDKEIISNNTTHPTLKMRMDALGIKNPVWVTPHSSEEYLSELKKLLEFSENVIYESIRENYEQDRVNCFLDPLARIEAWYGAGKPVSAETYADFISDFERLGRHKEAEELCNLVIEQLPKASTAYAVYTKGVGMLSRYDERGIELIYNAMEHNGNYIEAGLHAIGTFCCLTGRAETLKEYRAKAGEIAQKYKDHNEQLSYLSRRDNLTSEVLPDGMLEEILAFITSVNEDIIEEIYLIRKTVDESFFASVFVIKFSACTEEQSDELMHKLFRYLDSHPSDRQFALFDYLEYPDVDKIEDSLVFRKNNDDNEKEE